MGRIKPASSWGRASRPAWREFQLIADIRRLAGTRSKDRLGIGDDASAYTPAQKTQLEIVTCDALVENVHWSWQWCDPGQLGRKAAAAALSDIAAMGGTPARAHVVLAAPARMRAKTLRQLMAGLVKSLASHGARLTGGDTVSSPGPLLLAITVQGTVPRQELLSRQGARTGDVLMVTGHLGGAAAGLAYLRTKRKLPARLRGVTRDWLEPKPRIREGRIFARSGQVHAMLDISDGLAGDVRHLARASRVGIRLYAGQLPLGMATRLAAKALRQDPMTWALSGGEDYELLLAVSPRHAEALSRRVKARIGTPCTIVGEVLPARQGLSLVQPDGTIAALPPAWEHGALRA